MFCSANVSVYTTYLSFYLSWVLLCPFFLHFPLYFTTVVMFLCSISLFAPCIAAKVNSIFKAVSQSSKNYYSKEIMQDRTLTQRWMFMHNIVWTLYLRCLWKITKHNINIMLLQCYVKTYTAGKLYEIYKISQDLISLFSVYRRFAEYMETVYGSDRWSGNVCVEGVYKMRNGERLLRTLKRDGWWDICVDCFFLVRIKSDIQQFAWSQ